MKVKFVIILCLLLFACNRNNPNTYIEFLEGYWEIDRVELYNGEIKDYRINQTIDYISITDSLTGIRKKLNPNFSGTYETSKNFEKFTLLVLNDSLHMLYETPFDKWKESVLFANESKLEIINENKDVFLYKKYIPLKLD